MFKQLARDDIESAASIRMRRSGFALMEVIVAVLVLTTIGVAFYVGLSSCFSVLKASREDIRATQIMMQKLEAVRLCTWSELTNFSFKEPYDPTGTNNSVGTFYWDGHQKRRDNDSRHLILRQ